jgi:hypothetical protein
VEERVRHFEVVVPQLRSRITRIEELPDGYEFEFPGDEVTLGFVANWADGERRCCPFFAIELDHEGGSVWMRLTGPEGAKDFIRSELSLLFEPE